MQPKYRLWHKKLKKMDYVSELVWKEQNLKLKYISSLSIGFGYVAECGQLMAWTGLVDKNGLEIYDGDIINFTIENFMKGKIFEKGVVYWNSEQAAWKINNEPFHHFFLGDSWMREIIGNIYEHPHLEVGLPLSPSLE